MAQRLDIELIYGSLDVTSKYTDYSSRPIINTYHTPRERRESGNLHHITYITDETSFNRVR